MDRLSKEQSADTFGRILLVVLLIYGVSAWTIQLWSLWAESIYWGAYFY